MASTSSGTLLVNPCKTTTSVETEKTAARSCGWITRPKKREAARRSKLSACATLKEVSKSITSLSGWSALREKLEISCGAPSSRISKSSGFKSSEALDGLPAMVDDFDQIAVDANGLFTLFPALISLPRWIFGLTDFRHGAGRFGFVGRLFLRFGLLAAPALTENRSERREYKSHDGKKERQ